MKYEQMVFALFSSNENIKCDIFSNVQKYIDNQMSSDNYILFIGSNEATSKNMTAMLEMKYDKFGVKYATHGKVAQIWRESIIWNPKVVADFSEAYDAQIKRLQKLEYKNIIISGPRDAFAKVVRRFVEIGKLIETIIMSGKIKDAQYNFGIMLFVQDELEKFMQVKKEDDNDTYTS